MHEHLRFTLEPSSLTLSPWALGRVDTTQALTGIGWGVAAGTDVNLGLANQKAKFSKPSHWFGGWEERWACNLIRVRGTNGRKASCIPLGPLAVKRIWVWSSQSYHREPGNEANMTWGRVEKWRETKSLWHQWSPWVRSLPKHTTRENSSLCHGNALSP